MPLLFRLRFIRYPLQEGVQCRGFVCFNVVMNEIFPATPSPGTVLPRWHDDNFGIDVSRPNANCESTAASLAIKHDMLDIVRHFSEVKLKQESAVPKKFDHGRTSSLTSIPSF